MGRASQSPFRFLPHPLKPPNRPHALAKFIRSGAVVLQIGFTLVLLGLLSGCSLLNPHFLNIPVDASGRSVNSLFSESTPHIAGHYLVFVSDRNGSPDVYLYDLQQQRLVELPGLNALDLNASQADVSEDGQWIVFAASRQGQTDIYLYNRSTAQLRDLTSDLKAQVRNPSISAKGDIIAFESDAEGQWDITFRDRTGHAIAPPWSDPVPNSQGTKASLLQSSSTRVGAQGLVPVQQGE